MKTIFSVAVFSLISATIVFAQANTTKPLPPKLPFTIDTVAPSANQTGNSNYVVSYSDEDFKNKKYVFYTDSNATKAYININGHDMILRGWPESRKYYGLHIPIFYRYIKRKQKNTNCQCRQFRRPK